MRIKRLMLLALPAIALSVGIVALNTPSSSDNSAVNAADYTPSNRKLTFNNDGSVTATFSVNDNVLDSRGWLLCLFTDKPSFNPVTHKTDDSNTLHPYSTTECAHYFFASNTTKEGNISVTWGANFGDQKENWTESQSTGSAGHTLADYLAESTDWYIVAGIRHWHDSSWAPSGVNPGEGTNGWWENADYYVGRESVIKGNHPYGEIYIDLYEFRGWEGNNAKFAVYFFDGNGNHEFSDFSVCVSSADGLHIVSYELAFNPTNMICFRFDPNCSTPSTDNRWNQTQDLAFYRYGVIGITGWDYGWSDGLATVTITRGLEEIEVVLDNYKRNADHKSEHYNDYVDLQQNDEFVINYLSAPRNNWDCLEIFDNNFNDDDETHKIKVEVSGTYSFYFKAYNVGDVHYDVFISKPEVAFADAWALSFLNGGCTSTKDNWSTYAGEYNNLPHSAKTFLLNVEHQPDPEYVYENYFAQAIQRYDYVIYLYGTDTYNDYIGRVAAGRFTPRSSYSLMGALSSDSPTPIALVVVLLVVPVTVIGSYLFLRKRKESN